MIEYIVVNLKARLRPIHRHDLEDAFLEDCKKHNLALDIVGGGTLQAHNGEPLECDIEIEAIDNHQINDNDIQEICDFFNTVFAPKGSSLQVYEQGHDEPKSIAIGHLEGLSLRLNGQDLPAEVYQNNDINEVIAKCNELMTDIGEMHSYFETNHSYLYFYGTSFNVMKNAIQAFVDTHPLCQQCKIEQIA